MNPDIIVYKQIETYNARNLDEFAALFSQDVELYNFGENQPFLRGMEELRKVYKNIFDKSPELNASIEHKMILGNTIIYHEKVTGRIEKTLEVIAIYEIKDDLIHRLTFIRK